MSHQFEQHPSRPGAGASSDKATGKGPRVGNRPHTDADIDSFPQRHRSANKKVEKTSKNWNTREGGKQSGQNT